MENREPYFIDVDDPEAVMEVLSRLGRSLLRRRDIEQYVTVAAVN